MKVTYNYRKVFRHPITLYRIGDVRLPYGIALVRVIVAGVLFLLMLLFRDVIHLLTGWVPGLTLVVYVGVPYLVSGFLLKQSFNGKRIHWFLYDFFRYFFEWYVPKKQVANDEEVMHHRTSVTFEAVPVEGERRASLAAAHADQKNPRQPVVYEARRRVGVLPDISERHTVRQLRKAGGS